MSVRELQATTDQLRLIDLRRAAATSGITEAFFLDPEAHLPPDRGPGGRRLGGDAPRSAPSPAGAGGQHPERRRPDDLGLGPPFDPVEGGAELRFQRRRFHLRTPEALLEPQIVQGAM